MPFERVREAVRARALPAAPDAVAQRAAGALAAAGGGSVQAVLFFGSRRTQAGFDPWSAYDLFVLTRDYRTFYRGLRRAGILRRPAGLHAALNALLPPSQISFRREDVPGGEVHAKCAVIRLQTLRRETSRRRRDHFCIGRLFQPSEIVLAADAGAQEQALEALASAHVLTYGWVRAWLPPCFDAEAYGRALLRVSLAGEIRPEPAGRADALWEAQRGEQEPVYRILLEELAAAGELVESGGPGQYSLARSVSPLERARLRAYFAWSKVRATARWLKHVVTFEGWLDYILRKARRHAGEDIVLSPRERRWPLLLLWPRLLRYLRDRDRKGRTG